MSQDKPSIRTICQAEFGSEALQSGKPVLAVFTAPWSRPCQVLEATLNEVVPACDRRVEVVTTRADDNPGRTLLIV